MQPVHFMALLNELARLTDPSRVILVGSAAMAVRGIRDVNDLDVLAASVRVDEIRNKAPGCFGTEDAVAVQTPAGVIQAATSMRVFAAASPIETVDVADGADQWRGFLPESKDIRTIGLVHLVAFKKAVAREKDLADIELIEAYLEQHGNEIRERLQ